MIRQFTSPPRQYLCQVLTLFLLFAALFAIPVRAQTTRSSFTLHMYVDPLYGDDNLAATYNPKATGSRMPLMVHRTSKTPIGGYLQHFPYSFRTVTQAISFINSNFNPLPWTNSKTGKEMRKIVIHCLPGLYGPTGPGGPNIDPNSGLPWNGEVFPIGLPDRVSIQGTSALDTIFDGRGDEGFGSYIFSIRAPGNANVAFENCMIDSITIRNAHATESDAPPFGAGIYIDTQGQHLRISISNCFIVQNDVGIALGVPSGDGPALSPIIVNNTIAWNQIGIWSGQPFPQTSPFTNKGLALPRILNNIIDSNGPGMSGGLSCFEGILDKDLLVNVPGGPKMTFNAWDGPFNTPTAPYGRANRSVAVGSWPITSLRGTTTYATQILASVIDISPITKAGTTTLRGTLYINDLFRNAMAGYDYTPHDFRLAPFYSLSDGSPPSPSNYNVCANRGYTLLPISFVSNAPQILTFPGLTGPGVGLDTEFAQMNAWDYDAEGFGNWRITLLSGWPTYTNRGFIDLGADEIDSLIMAGYIFRTRIFSRMVPNGPGTDSTPIFFVDAPNVTLRKRPTYTGYLGQDFLGTNTTIDNRWWQQAQANPAPPVASVNYTAEGATSFRWLQITTRSFRYFMRNLQCDFSPHLILDPHPVWAVWFNTEFSFNNLPSSVYGSHPWFDNPDVPDSNNTPLSPDNWNLYYNPGGGGGSGARPASAVYDGTLNPPGTWWNAPGSPGSSFLYPGIPTAQFGPFGTGGPTFYSTDSWGMGDSQGLDVAPDTGWHGFRFNCQVEENGVWGNLQSFLTVNGFDPGSALKGYKLPKAKPKASVIKWADVEKARKRLVDYFRNKR